LPAPRHPENARFARRSDPCLHGKSWRTVSFATASRSRKIPQRRLRMRQAFSVIAKVLENSRLRIVRSQPRLTRSKRPRRPSIRVSERAKISNSPKRKLSAAKTTTPAVLQTANQGVSSSERAYGHDERHGPGHRQHSRSEAIQTVNHAENAYRRQLLNEIANPTHGMGLPLFVFFRFPGGRLERPGNEAAVARSSCFGLFTWLTRRAMTAPISPICLPTLALQWAAAARALGAASGVQGRQGTASGVHCRQAPLTPAFTKSIVQIPVNRRRAQSCQQPQGSHPRDSTRGRLSGRRESRQIPQISRRRHAARGQIKGGTDAQFVFSFYTSTKL